MAPAVPILFVGDVAAAVATLAAVREGGPVEARLATTADAVRSALAEAADGAPWGAVVFASEGPVNAADVVADLPAGAAPFVVGDAVPAALAEIGAEAVAPDALRGLVGRLAARRPAPADGPRGDSFDAEADLAVPGTGRVGPAVPAADEAAGPDDPAAGPPVEAVQTEHLASLADHLSIGLYRSAPDGRILYANPALAHLLGVGSVAELDGLDVRTDLGYPRAAFAEEIGRAGAVRNLVQSWVRPEGDRVHTRENARAITDAAGRLLYYEGTMEDVTAEVEALRELRDTEASLAVVAEHTPHTLYRLRYTPDGPAFDYLSPAVEDLIGLPRAEIDARGGLGAFVEHREVLEGDGLAVGPVPGAALYRVVYRMATARGPRHVENSARPWHDAAGTAVGLVGVLQDITERKLREDRLADAAQAAIERQRALVDLAHLDADDAVGEAAAAVAAAALGASAVSFWRCEPDGPVEPLHAPPPADPAAPAAAALGRALAHVGRCRALAVADARTDDRVGAMGLKPFVEAYGLRSLLVAPVRRHARVAGLVVVHRTDGPHDWDGSETEFAAAVADAVALALARGERQRAAQALVEAREAAEAGRAAAERLNAVKDSFLANMSHEIRTPLTAVLGNAEILNEEVSATLRPLTGSVLSGGRRLLSTLNAVLDLAQIEAGQMTPTPRPVDVAEFVRAAARDLSPIADAKGLAFDVDAPDDLPEVAVDDGILDRARGGRSCGNGRQRRAGVLVAPRVHPVLAPSV